MAPVYGAEAGLSVAQISIFVSVFFIAALVLQLPIGWISDRMDRRKLIMICSVLMGGGAVVGGFLGGGFFLALLLAAFLIGGMSNPLYSLLIAYTNDFLSHEDMAAAAGGLVFINGLGAVAGPVITGWLMGLVGPWGYFAFIGFLAFAMAIYALYRMTQCPAPSPQETDSYAPVMPMGAPLSVEYAQEYAIEVAQEQQADEER
jgi:MFS family permease